MSEGKELCQPSDSMIKKDPWYRESKRSGVSSMCVCIKLGGIYGGDDVDNNDDTCLQNPLSRPPCWRTKHVEGGANI